VFFFSSRRRHTSFSRDWSSDVCSSDLDASYIEPDFRAFPLRRHRAEAHTGRAWSARAAYHGGGRAGLTEAGIHFLEAQGPKGIQIGRASCRERVWMSVAPAAV